MMRTATRRAGIAGLLAVLLATAAFAGQTQRLPTPQPRIPATLVAPPPAAPSATSPLPVTQALFDGYVRQGKMPGIVGAFGFGELPPVFVAAGKIADDAGAAPANPDSLWRVYSMTKPITAMAAMTLIEQGRIGLDDPVSKYIPGFAHMRVLTDPEHSLASRPAARPVTIRNLLTHTAGLGYSIITKGPLLHEYERLGILPGALSPATEVKARAVRPTSLKEFADRVATLPLIADPGTTWSYSIGLDVMGRVIEVASGMPFDAYVNTHIFAPLRMTSSYWTVPAGEVGRLATNYAILGPDRVPLDPAHGSVFLQRPSFPYGGAGLVMSARDYDRFLHALQDGGTLDGVRVLKSATVALMTSNLLPAGVTFGGVSGKTGGTQGATPMGFGAGGSVTLADMPGGLHKGTYGWGGAAGTIAWVDRVGHARGTVMVNYTPPDAYPLRTDVGRALAQDIRRFGQ